MSEQRYKRLERRYTRAFRWGLVISLVAHVLLFLVFDTTAVPPSPFAAAGDRRGDDRAALGGGMQAVEMQSPSRTTPTPPVPVEEEPTLEPEEVVEPPEPEMDDVAIPSVQLADRLTLPGARGALDVPGLAQGTGEGDGGTEAEGRFRVVAPKPRGLIFPPNDLPDQVRGQGIEVWVFVNARGRVVADSTRLNPPTGDRRFDRRLRERAAGWVFEPARRDGHPVAEWFRWSVTK